MKRYSIGIDVGGTKTAYGIFDEKRTVVKSLVHPSDSECSPEIFFDIIAGNISKMISGCNIAADEIFGACLAMPSFILYDEGFIIKTSNLIKIKEFPARDYLSKKIGMPVILDNDARAAGMAEYRYGAGRGFDRMFFCPLSTGISSSLIINGEPFRGSYGWAGESGHMIATPGEGLECGCGNRGCYMSWCSGSMLSRHIKNWIASGEPTIMTELAGGIEKIDTLIMEKAFDKGDAMAKKALDQIIHWLGVWFFNLYVSYNVNCFVVGGGLVNLGDKLLVPIRREFDGYNHDSHPVYLKTAECANPGTLGASELLLRALGES